MTNQEFSDGFSTLLNSYNTQALFGEQASKAEIVLDEYEKSVFLTQAQDQLVKSYFDVRADQLQEGFDGSERRQMDFSGLITVKSILPYNRLGVKYTVKSGNTTIGTIVIRNVLYRNYPKIKDYPIDLSVVVAPSSGMETNIDFETKTASNNPVEVNVMFTQEKFVSNYTFRKFINDLMGRIESDTTTFSSIFDIEIIEGDNNIMPSNFTFQLTIPAVNEYAGECFDPRGIMFNIPNDPPLLYMLNEKLFLTIDGKEKGYTVVPINYREYDRQTSKPYAQPLKKQCWRLFQNEVDTMSEIIPIWNLEDKATEIIYKVRYIRRPRPIILEDLPDDLEIDGRNLETPCELNPVIHMDILERAFQLAVTSRGGTPAATQQRRRQRNTDNED